MTTFLYSTLFGVFFLPFITLETGYEFDLSHYEGAFAFDDITGQLAGGHCENALIASYDWIPGRDVPHAFDLLAQIAALEAQLGHVPKPWSYYWSQVSRVSILYCVIRQAFFSTFSLKLSGPKTPKISKLSQNFCQNSHIFAKTRTFLFKTQFSGKNVELKC